MAAAAAAVVHAAAAAAAQAKVATTATLERVGNACNAGADWQRPQRREHMEGRTSAVPKH